MRKLSKVFAVSMAAVMGTMMLAGCGGSSSSSTAASSTKAASTAASSTKAESTTAASSTKAESTTAASSKSEASETTTDFSSFDNYEFSFTVHDPDTSAKVQYMQTLCDAVNEATDGHVTFTMYTGGTLLAAKDVAAGVEDGTADIGWLYTTFNAGEFPMTELVTLPLVFEDNIQADKVLIDLYNESPDVQEELNSRYHVLSLSTNPMNNIYTNTEISSISDLNGLSLRATAGVATELVKGLGGSPILMGPGDMYESIEKNVLNGYVFEWSGVNSFNLYEVTKYCIDEPLFCGVFLVVMNKDKWDSLPVEFQDIITEIWSEGSLGQSEVFLDDAEIGKETGTEAGVQLVTLSDSDKEALQKVADDYIANYIETYDCQDAYDLTMEILERYK